MASHRSTTDGRTLKPTLASNRTPRTPIAPRIAVAPASSPSQTVRRPLAIRQDAAKATLNARATPPRQEETSVKELGNVTPRSSTRKSRVDGGSLPSQAEDSPSGGNGRSSGASDLDGRSSGASLGSTRANRPASLISDDGRRRARSPLTVSPGFVGSSTQPVASIESRFFHASEARNLEPVVKKPEPKKAPAFFYANGQDEAERETAVRIKSPPLSLLSEARSSGPRARTDPVTGSMRSPPILSPSLSTVSNSSPFFAPLPPIGQARSPSPSKENIHLSYRKGASQIFGSRPSPLPSPHAVDVAVRPTYNTAISSEKQTPHRKSPSLSSLDSSNSPQPRRRSATTLEPNPTSPSPLASEVKPTIDPVAETPLSPTKALTDLAADARRERKLLDLEISNSSLLAINASLEREVRRQKTELKRFRRLSRAGHFQPTARLSEGLSVVDEDDEEEDDPDYAAFGPPSGLTDLDDDFSNSDSESVFSSSGGLSPSRRSSSARLARDEERLRVDLERHKELLVQSQMVNQSLKRCTIATEDLLREGRKALDYHVRVSDVRLGGRVLASPEPDIDDHSPDPDLDISIEDDTLLPAEQSTLGFLDVWAGVGSDARASVESSDFGDRDSGIEVDKPGALAATGTVEGKSILGGSLDRPPETVRGRAGLRGG